MEATAGTVTEATGAFAPVLAKLKSLLDDECTPGLDESRDDIAFIVSKLEPVLSCLEMAWEREDLWTEEARELPSQTVGKIDDLMVLGMAHGGGGGGINLLEGIKLQVQRLVMCFFEMFERVIRDIISSRGMDDKEATDGTVTASTGALGPVLVKLESLLGLEESRGDILLIISGLKPVHSFLESAWEHFVVDEAMKDWMVEARKLSLEIKGKIDKFVPGMAHGGTNLLEGIMLQVQDLVCRFFECRFTHNEDETNASLEKDDETNTSIYCSEPSERDSTATGAFGPILAKLKSLLADERTPGLDERRGDIKFIILVLEPVLSCLDRVWKVRFLWTAEARKLPSEIGGKINNLMVLGMAHGGGGGGINLLEGIKLQVRRLVICLFEIFKSVILHFMRVSRQIDKEATGALGPVLAKLKSLLADVGTLGLEESRGDIEIIISGLEHVHSVLESGWEEHKMVHFWGVAFKDWTAEAWELSLEIKEKIDKFVPGMAPGGGTSTSINLLEGTKLQVQDLVCGFFECFFPDDETSKPSERDSTQIEAGTVTAATGALGPVLAKLKSLLAEEATTPGLEESRDDIDFIISKLKLVHSLLLRIWEREDIGAACKGWTVEARELSYGIKDTIDDYFVLGSGRTFTSLIAGIKRQVQELVSSPCWEELETTSNRCEEPTLVVDPRARFLHKDESDLVEMEKKKAELTKLLQEHEVVCILGFAGMGKTTLADLVYQDKREKFECHAFVSISPGATVTQVMATILSQLTAHHGPSASNEAPPPADKRTVTTESALTSDTDTRAEQDPIQSVSDFITNKRYFVIIDDVADCKQLEDIRYALPMNKLGSRIIMCTRVDAIAKKCMTDNYAIIYKNSGLSVDAAAALSETILNKSCKDDTVPSDLHDPCYSIAKMSGGMPLAVTCMSMAVAEQLAGEEGQEHDADTMPRDRFHVAENRALEGLLSIPCLKPLVESLCIAYHDLPLHLKTCLLHCSVYPPYHILERDDLVRMWIAEGFVYKEEKARRYCDELVSSGWIQQCSALVPAPRYEMNPIMLQFLRCKSQEDYRIAYLDCGFDMSSLHVRRVRRLSVRSYKNSLDISTLPVSDTRSLYVFDHSWRIPFGNFGHLRVLHLHGNNLKTAALVDICGLSYLSCLSLKGALINLIPKKLKKLKHLKTLNVSNTGILRIPGEIAELQHLETLDVSNTMVTELPSEIISRLQHLKTLDLANSSFLELPREIGDLQDLETLDVSNTMISNVPREIGMLQHLKTLNVSNTMVSSVPREIGKLQHLETLNISNTMVTVLPSIIRRLRHLKTMNLANSSLKKLPTAIGELQDLETLDVSNTTVSDVPREIGKLQHLKTLNICNTRIRELPWEAARLSNLVRVLVGSSDAPKDVRLRENACNALKYGNTSSFEEDCGGDLGSVISLALFDCFGSSWEPLDFARFKICSRHMSVPQWVEDHLSDISSLEISLWKLEDVHVKCLQKMSNLKAVTLRVEVLPIKGISITGDGDGFKMLESLCIDCRVPRVTFEKGAMPKLKYLEYKFYAFRETTENPMGIKHLQSLQRVVFRSASWYKSDAQGIHAVIDKVRKEAKEHSNRITLCVNGKEEVFPEKGIDKLTCVEKSTNGAGSREANGIKTNFFVGGNKEDVSQVSNNQARRIVRSKTYTHYKKPSNL